MFRRLFSRKGAPLAGAPQIPRLKTYSAQTGYVYQYFYRGHRRFVRAGSGGTEYVFDVSADRKSFVAVSVLLDDQASGEWERRHDRKLTATEQYAIAKMALFQAFDERPTPAAIRSDVCVRAADVAGILTALDLD